MNLFENIRIKDTILKNSFFRAATWEGLADEDGHLTDELVDVYRELAKGGVAAIITGYARILEEEKANENMMGIYSDIFIKEYINLTDMIHDYGAKIFLQVAYGGSMSKSNLESTKVFAPSNVMNERSGNNPTACTVEDMNYIKEAFVQAAIRSEKSGFDGIELHAGHGYFLSQWLSPKYNIREDEYGGNIENRSRFIGEIIQAIRDNVSDEFLILVKQNSEDFHDAGLSSEDSIKASRIFEIAGADAIEVTGGDLSIREVINNNLGASRGKLVRRRKNESYFKDHAIKLSESIGIEVILTGGNRHLATVEKISDNSNIKFYGLCRPLICEPNLINKWYSGETGATKCVSCNGCFSQPEKQCIINIS